MSVLDTIGLGPTRTERPLAKGWFEITVTPNTAFLPSATPASVRLTPDQYQRYKAWRNGRGLIQDLLPDISPRERDILMSGTST